jgi:hypothetical protein
MELIYDPENVVYVGQEEAVAVLPGEKAVPADKARPRQKRVRPNDAEGDDSQGVVEEDEEEAVEKEEEECEALKKSRKGVPLSKRGPSQQLKADPAASVARAKLDIRNSKYVQVSKESPVQLHCNACGTTFGTRANVVKRHIESKSHLAKVEAQEAKAKAQASLEEAFARQQDGAQKKAEAVHRERTLAALAEANVAVNALTVTSFKELLEEDRPQRLSLGDPSDMARDHLAVVVAQRDTDDLERVLASGGIGTLIVDGNSEKEEFAIIVLRTCDESFMIDERIVHMKMFRKTLNGQQWTREVYELTQKLKLKPPFTLGDGHGVNGVMNKGLEAPFLTITFIHAVSPILWRSGATSLISQIWTPF